MSTTGERDLVARELRQTLSDLAVDFASILGVGVDVEEISRWRIHTAAKQRLFTAVELAWCSGTGDPDAALASTWSAKEAVFKAVSPHQLLDLRKIEIRHTVEGRPTIDLGPEFTDLAARLRVSLSRTQTIAIAVALHLR